jgi:diadenosine tetraphosphate (Ap4A) HIT family hydrolase
VIKVVLGRTNTMNEHQTGVPDTDDQQEQAMTLPYLEPLTPRPPADLVVPEPPRRGEPGGEDCGPCAWADHALWSDQNWTLHNPGQTGLPGSVWMASRVHVDSFADLPAECASTFGVVAGKVERALLGLGGVGRVHLYRWGDGGAHFHVWFLPRPLGRLDMMGAMLPIWEDTMTPASDQEIAAIGQRIAAAMNDEPATA